MEASAPEMPPELIASIQYQKEHIHEDRTGEMVGVAWFLWALAVVALGLRFYAERMVRNRFGYHDALILLGLVGSALRTPRIPNVPDGFWQFFTTGLCINVSVCTLDHRFP